MEFYDFPYIGHFITPTDFNSIIFQRGRLKQVETTNQLGFEHDFWSSYLFVLIAPGIFAEPPSTHGTHKNPVSWELVVSGWFRHQACNIHRMIIGLVSKVIAKLPPMSCYTMRIPIISVMASDSSNWYESSCHRLIVA